MARVKVTRMPALHTALMDAFFAALKGDLITDAGGIPILDSKGKPQYTPPKANVLKEIREFLKDNGIDREPDEASAIPEMTRQLRKYDDDEPLLIEEHSDTDM